LALMVGLLERQMINQAYEDKANTNTGCIKLRLKRSKTGRLTHYVTDMQGRALAGQRAVAIQSDIKGGATVTVTFVVHPDWLEIGE